MKSNLRQIALFLSAFALIALFTLLSTAYGTASGFGRDLGHLGDGIQRAAR